MQTEQESGFCFFCNNKGIIIKSIDDDQPNVIALLPCDICKKLTCFNCADEWNHCHIYCEPCWNENFLIESRWNRTESDNPERRIIEK